MKLLSNRIGTLILFPSIIIYFFSCAPTTYYQSITPTPKKLISYNLDSLSQVSVGDAILSIEDVLVLEVYIATRTFATPPVRMIDLSMKQMPPVEKNSKWILRGKNLYDPNEVFIEEENPIIANGMMISISPDGYINRGWSVTLGTNKVITINDDWPAGQVFIKSNMLSKQNSVFKVELIYSGISGSNLKLVYREFSKDFARPAFFQDLQYDLNESNIIAFKQFRIEVVEATNSLIEFKIISDNQ